MDEPFKTKPTAYIETSVISYLTARPSRDVVVTAYQQVTRDWWRNARNRFDLVASELVIAEASAGDTNAARARLAALKAVALLDATEDAAHSETFKPDKRLLVANTSAIPLAAQPLSPELRRPGEVG